MWKRYLTVTTLLTLFALIMPASAIAQDQVHLSSLHVDLWPEYDRHSLLVIYRGVLAADTTFPVDLVFRIPSGAGEPHAVAAKQIDGVPYNVTYEREIRGAWALISFTTTAPEVQLEYYDITLLKEGEQRSYNYTWPGDYAVDTMVIQVQAPFNTTNMQISPSLGNGVVGNDGLTYYSAEVGALASGQTFEIDVQYSKTDDKLSAEVLQVAPSSPIPESTTAVNLLEIWPWLLAVLGAVLIIGGVWWYWRGSSGEQKPKRQRRGNRASKREPAVIPMDADVYCHQCGKRASPGDRFCRSCGTRLRIDG
jgi:hypothetical protein